MTYVMACGVGIIGGLVGTAFATSRRALTGVIIGKGGLLPAALALPWYGRLLIPFCGAIVTTFLAWMFSRRAATQGMTDVMQAVTLRRARHLRVGPTIARAVTSLALIASGGAVGREGPIAYLSASLSTAFARISRVPRSRVSLYSGCGVAAGMSAAYYAPLGAALFALEVVLGNFAIDILAPVVVSSVVAALVVNGFAEGPFAGYMKPSPLYDLAPFAGHGPKDLLVFLLMGFSAAVAIWAFLRAMSRSESLFERVPTPIRLPLGGLLLGIISIPFCHTWGGGHDTVNWLMNDPHPSGVLSSLPLWEFIAMLLVAKIIATSVTLGSGGWGGIFTPNILVGSCVGMLFAFVAFRDAPPDQVNGYAVIGMAAGLAAATQAPIMAMVFVLEMTRQPNLIPGLMVASIAASISARAMGLQSIYVSPLIKRGFVVPEGIEETTLTLTRVKDLMREEAVWVNESATFDMIVGMFQKTRRDTVFVVNNAHELIGVIRLHDIKNFLADPDLGAAVIAADLVAPMPRTHPEQTLAEILDRFDDPELHEVAVVEPNSGRFLGVLDRRDLITQLSVEVLQRRGLRAKFVDHEGAQHYVEMPQGHALSRIPVPPAMVHQTLAEACFQQKTGLTVLTIVRRTNGQDRRVQPEPGTHLEPNDALIVMGPIESIHQWGGTA